MNKKTTKQFVIGVDGGGTKTAVALADMSGKIIARAVAGGSRPRDIGIPAAAKNIAEGIYGVLKRKRDIKIVSTFLGLPAFEEEFKDAKDAIVSALKKQKKIAKIFKGKIIVGSDQLAAFRTGANGKDGIVAVAGTGSAIHGWNNGREVLVNDQGWVGKGGAEWIGRMVTYAIAEAWDGRGDKTSLTDLVFRKYKLKDVSKLLKFVYLDSKADLPKLAVLCDQAATGGDKVAQAILVQAGKELALSVRVATAKLIFSDKTPLILVGGTYKSRWVADTMMNEVERYYPKMFDFVVVADPVVGAVKLAIENVEVQSIKRKA